MSFKIDFEKLHNDWWSGLSEEDKERITKHEQLEEENTFYTTTTSLDNDYMKVKYNKERKEESQEVKLYRYVSNHNEVDKKSHCHLEDIENIRLIKDSCKNC